MPLLKTNAVLDTSGIAEISGIKNDTPQPTSLGCKGCGTSQLQTFFTVSEVPAHVGLQWQSPQQAQSCSKGNIALAWCERCGLITNVAFDINKLDYTQAYDNSLHFSSVFQNYARELASRLINQYDLYNKDIIEVGCGRGDFLNLLCHEGKNRGVGFDPSYEQQETTHSVRVIKDYYSEKYAHYPVDFLCCRFVLEHIADPIPFLTTIKKAIGFDTVVYFEVPNALSILRDVSIWDVIYEHCLYFTPQSLAQTFAMCGFEVLDVNETYDGQYIGIEAISKSASAGIAKQWQDNNHQYTTNFSKHWEDKNAVWKDLLKQIRHSQQRAILWGAGAKSVSFLNALQVKDDIPYVVDLNPRKQGKHMAGTGQQIVAPEFLKTYQPDVVVIANPIYQNEIKKSVRELGLSPRFLNI